MVSATTATAADADIGLENVRVLVLDDEEVVRRTAESILARAGPR